MEHGLKVIAFYVQKAYNTLHSCHNFPAGSRQADRGARICETSLLGYPCSTADALATNGAKHLQGLYSLSGKTS